MEKLGVFLKSVLSVCFTSLVIATGDPKVLSIYCELQIIVGGYQFAFYNP